MSNRKPTARQRSLDAHAAAAAAQDSLDDSTVIPPSDDDEQQQMDDDDEPIAAHVQPPPAPLVESSPSPPPVARSRLRKLSAGSSAAAAASPARTAAAASARATATPAAPAPALPPPALPASTILFDKLHMQQRLQQMKAAAAAKPTASAEKRERDSVLIPDSDDGDADDDADEDEPVVISAKAPLPSPPAAAALAPQLSSWKSTRRKTEAQPAAAAVETKGPRKKATAPSKRIKSSSSDDGVIPDDAHSEGEGAMQSDDPDFEPSPEEQKQPTRAKSKPSTLRDHFKAGSQNSEPSSSQPSSSQRNYSLSLTASRAAKREPAKPDKKKTTPKKRYRSIVPDADDEDDEDVSIVDKPRKKGAEKEDQSRATKRAKLAPAPAAPRKALNLVAASSSPPPPVLSLSAFMPPQPKGPPSILWIDKYAPRSESDLCVHKTKINDVKQWILQFGLPPPPRHPNSRIHSPMEAAGYGHGQTMLILAGPPGSGKSALIRVLAASLGYSIVTWDDDNYEPFVKREDRLKADRHAEDDPQRYESKRARFRSFFESATRYALTLTDAVADLSIAAASTRNPHMRAQAADAARAYYSELAPISALVSTPTVRPHAAASSSSFGAPSSRSAGPRSLVVIEDFPHSRDDEKREFLSLLESALPRTRFPIIFLLTTEHEAAAGDFLIEKTFGKELITNRFVRVMQVNKVAATGMKAALNRVLDGEGIELPKELVQHLMDSCKGDVRHAINALQFHSVADSAANGSADIAKDLKPKSRRRRKAAGGDSEKLPERDETFSIFHSVGKIIYAKSSELRAVDAIIESSDVEPLRFLEWIYTNYLYDRLDAPNLKEQQASGFSTAAGKQLGSAAASAASSSKASAAAAAKPQSSPTSYFDDDDLDGDAFDLIMAGAHKPQQQQQSNKELEAAQAKLDAEALAAIVSVSSSFSDADVLARASFAEYGDSMSAVEQMQAAEVACIGYMIAKRGLSWSAEEEREREEGKKRELKGRSKGARPFQGPLTTKLRILQTQKHDLFKSLFLNFNGSELLELDVLHERVQINGRPTPKQVRIMQKMQGFAGRDFLLRASWTFVELLPFFSLITAKLPAANSSSAARTPAAPYATAPSASAFTPRLMPPPPPRQQAIGVVRPPGALIAYMPPKPSPLQLAFLRLLSSYHPFAFLEKLTKDQMQACESLQAQVVAAPMRQVGASADQLPTATTLEEVLEEIED